MYKISESDLEFLDVIAHTLQDEHLTHQADALRELINRCESVVTPDSGLNIKMFNTGRGYSSKGQRIVWCIAKGYLFFFDVDRHIHGVMTDIAMHTCTVENEIMYLYDNNKYEPIPFQHRDIELLLKQHAGY